MPSAIESSQCFRHSRVVRFGECDPAGVAYYPEFFNWFHQAMEACFEDYLEIPYAEMIETIGFPAVQTSAEFRKPLPVGSSIDIEVRIERLGRSSIEWRFDIRRDDTIAAIGRVKTVCISVSAGEFQFASAPVPALLIPKLQNLIIESH
jgi:4-hydroxybenzoyl-CoA thioesterase